jgi:hypothetical protein
LLPNAQELVDLLLVLRDGEPRLGVVDDVGQLLLDGVLVERHRDAAERLRGEDGPVQLGAVVADHGHLVAPGEPERGQPQGDPSASLVVVPPRVSLPDTEVLLPDGDTASPPLGVVPDELGERVERRGHAAHRLLVNLRTMLRPGLPTTAGSRVARV